MCFDIYEPVWFKFGLMTDTTKLYIGLLVSVTFILMHGYCSARKQKHQHQFSGIKFSFHFDGLLKLLRFLGLMDLNSDFIS